MTFRDVLVRSCMVGALLALGCGGDSAKKNPWAGQTYLIEVPASSWAEPRGVGGEFGEFVPQFLLAVEEGSESELDVHLGTARDGAQDRCGPTTRAAAAADYPAVQIGPSALNVHIVHEFEQLQVNTTILDFTLHNVLPGGGEPAEEGELTGMMDVRELYTMFTLLGPRRSPDTVCNAVASFGAACGACPTDGATYCIAVRANYFGAREVEMQLEPISADSLDATCLE